MEPSCDDLYGIEDQIEQHDRFYSGRVERHERFVPHPEDHLPQGMIDARRRWINKLLGENDVPQY